MAKFTLDGQTEKNQNTKTMIVTKRARRCRIWFENIDLQGKVYNVPKSQVGQSCLTQRFLGFGWVWKISLFFLFKSLYRSNAQLILIRKVHSLIVILGFILKYHSKCQKKVAENDENFYSTWSEKCQFFLLWTVLKEKPTLEIANLNCAKLHPRCC